MKTIQFLKMIVLSMFIIGCGQDKKEERSSSMQAESDQAKQKREIIVGDFESNFTKAEIAKFTMATILDQKPEVLSVREKEGVLYVAYTPSENEEKQEYKIRINGNRIIYGKVPGRWRTTKKDEKIAFEENANKITIIQTFNDGSSKVKEFSK